MPSKEVLNCARILAEKQWTVGFVESCTAGRASAEFALTPESGKILMGGIVTYDASFKEHMLDIPIEFIEKYTPESAEVTEAMAKSFCKFSGSDVCVAVTGLISPGGSETAEKPVGTIFIHIVFPHIKVESRIHLDGKAEEIIMKSIDAIATMIGKEILKMS